MWFLHFWFSLLIKLEEIIYDTAKKVMASLKGKKHTIKKLVARCKEDGTNYHLAIKELRATYNLQSPADLIFGRQLKTTLPTITRPPANSEAVGASDQAKNTAEMMLTPKRYATSSHPSKSGYKTLFPKKWIQM